MIGLKKGVVKLCKNSAGWKKSFEKEKERLGKIFGEDAIKICHIGSTAIAPICAKPIIDIGIIVDSFSIVEKYLAELKRAGYILKRENRKDRMFFVKGAEDKRTHYLHIGKKGSGYIEDMILFRDYLLENMDIAKRYEKLKKGLGKTYSKERDIYTLKKEKFILDIVNKIKSRSS